jgi:hypothetical protein
MYVVYVWTYITQQGCTNSEVKVGRGLNFVQWHLFFFNLLHAMLLAPRILRGFLDIWRTCATQNTYIMAYSFSCQGLSLLTWPIQNSFWISECFRYQTGGGGQLLHRRNPRVLRLHMLPQHTQRRRWYPCPEQNSNPRPWCRGGTRS